MVVYPRWRGEHLFSQIYGLLLFGLSPLARGTRAHGIQSRVSARFIPAGAGNTCKYYLVPIIGTVYPRWRGEHAVQNFLKRFNCGLSPLARGTHTPLSNSCDLPTVYPRWRGEHIDPEQQYAQTDGLSPLARGTLLCRFHITGLPRFIPAGAGNTTVQTAGYYFFAVYPRWRGEHLLLELVECCYSGLSPLARGTQRQVVAALRGRRFIPAGAGNTAWLWLPL
ncbi:Domain of uncharacterised function (DUF2825) [Escherichia coli]|uniref:Domain of uncharacterized function (DUF2825) n=1 Tax=Escherichia coli TaxID=562 RepID=A0A2Y8NGP5_ECOLX|nr:Domain of uncharacterised function (DUF2825) [Escherichia coli]SRY42623.1 Domain of uncharacterised function (DUF2825) [Escherichia coli]